MICHLVTDCQRHLDDIFHTQPECASRSGEIWFCCDQILGQASSHSGHDSSGSFLPSARDVRHGDSLGNQFSDPGKWFEDLSFAV